MTKLYGSTNSKKPPVSASILSSNSWQNTSASPVIHKTKMKKQILNTILIHLIVTISCFSQDKTIDSNTMDFNTEMKNEFEEIINYFKSKGEMHSITEADTRSFIDYLLDQTEYTKKKLTELISKVNYETIECDQQYKLWPHIELWRGVDDYGSVAIISHDGDHTDIEDLDNIVIGRYENYTIKPDSVRLQELKERQSIKIDINKYPISHRGYHEYRFSETALFYAWIAKIWQEVQGYKCGIKVKTIQNNSIAMFSLNDFLVGDLSEFMEGDYGDKPLRLSNYFPRNLSLIEIFLRASQSTYPFNPFNTYWRYFQKDDQFQEIGTYEFKTGVRRGQISDSESSTISDIRKHMDSKEALLYIRDFTNQMINEGWEEKLRPLEFTSKFDENAFQFGYWTGIHWTKDQSTKLTEQQVIKLEKSLNITLPNSYFNYLRILDGRQHNSYNMFFPINNLYTVHIKKFYTIEEMYQNNRIEAIQSSNNLFIGETMDSLKIGINVEKGTKSFGKMTMQTDGIIKECDYYFEIFAKYAQGSPKQPEIYAAEQNDADFLKKRLNEGWDYSTSYQYQNALSQAAEHNSYDALEVLLQAGARLKHKKYRDHMKGTYDERTMEILDNFHKEE